MAKTCMLNREKRRAAAVKKHAVRRAALKEAIRNPKSSQEERMEAVTRLQKLPRDANPIRRRNRCQLTGRAHGYYRKFGLARNALRKMAMQGHIPGLVKASW